MEDCKRGVDRQPKLSGDPAIWRIATQKSQILSIWKRNARFNRGWANLWSAPWNFGRLVKFQDVVGGLPIYKPFNNHERAGVSLVKGSIESFQSHLLIIQQRDIQKDKFRTVLLLKKREFNLQSSKNKGLVKKLVRITPTNQLFYDGW